MKSNLTPLAIILITVGATIVIVGVASTNEIYVPRKPTYQTPEIPMCDEELWIRIKEFCKEIDDE